MTAHRHLSRLRQPASGNFCSACGASLMPRTCAALPGRAVAPGPLLPPLRPAGRRRAPAGAPAARAERTAWLVAGALCVVLLGGHRLQGGARGRPAPAAPDMANAGAQGPGRPAPTRRALPGPAAGHQPDDARASGSTGCSTGSCRPPSGATPRRCVRFTPMALGAYAQLDSVDADARYHAAVLRLQVGDFAGALALADTILRAAPGPPVRLPRPGHRRRASRTTAPAAARPSATSCAHYAAESGASRPEYREHEPAIEEFKQQADGADGGGSRR